MCGRVTIMIVLLFKFSTSQLIFESEDNNGVIIQNNKDLKLSYTLAETALRIFKCYNDQHFILIFPDDSITSNYFVRAVQNTSPIIILNSLLTIALTTIPQDMYLFCNNISVVQRFALELNLTQSTIDRKSQILIILTMLNVEMKMNDNIYEVMKIFWEAQFYNVVALYFVPQKNSVPIFRAKRYNLSYKSGNVLEDVTNKLISGEVFFDPIQGLSGYSLRVGMRNTSFAQRLQDKKGIIGLDEEMVLVLSKIMQVSIDVQLFEQDLTKLLNTSDNIQHFSTSQIDVWMSSMHIYHEIMEFIEFSYPHMKDDACILIPKGNREPQYFNILYTFNAYSFAATMASVIALSIIMTIVNKIESQFYHTKRYSGYYFFNMIQIFFNSGVMLPKTLAERITFINITIFVYFMEVMLQSVLTSNLAVTRYYPDVNTIQELLKTDYQILMPEIQHDFVIKRMDPDLIDKLMPVIKIASRTDIKEFLNSNNVTYGILFSRSFEEFLTKKAIHMIQNRPVYHIMQECPVPGHLAYYAPRGSLFLPAMNYAVLRVIETGFTHVWQLHLTDFEENVTTANLDVPKENVITARHFLSAFVIYIIGIVLSISAFVSEIRNSIRKYIRRV